MTPTSIHQYACLRCRSRRVRCDRHLSGCSNCASHGTQCCYSERRPRKSRSQLIRPDAPKQLQPAPSSLLPAEPNFEQADCRSGPSLLSDRNWEDYDADEEDDILPREMRDMAFEAKNDNTSSDRGILLVDTSGKSRYISGVKLKEVAPIETIMSETDPAKLALLQRAKTAATCLLNQVYEGRDLRSFHPPPEVMLLLWDYYCQTTDVMVKVLYKPIVRSLVTRASQNLDSMDSKSEAPLLFAIWYVKHRHDGFKRDQYKLSSDVWIQCLDKSLCRR